MKEKAAPPKTPAPRPRKVGKPDHPKLHRPQGERREKSTPPRRWEGEEAGEGSGAGEEGQRGDHHSIRLY